MTAPYPLTVDQLEDGHALILGTTGSGKTYQLRGCLEQLRRADRRVGAVDKLGNLWGLTLAADGKSPGLEFIIFGGKRAHVPMTPDQGAQLGRLFVERNIPAIFDVSQWKSDEQERWVADFADAVFSSNEGALHLAFDEVQSWAPQGGGGEAFRSVQRLAEQGRGNGIRLLLSCQRLSRLDATVRGMMHLVVAMRTPFAIDRKAVADLVARDKADLQLLEHLPNLKTGSGYLWEPTGAGLELIRFPANTTFDSSRTPRHGDTPPAPIAVSSALVDELRTALAVPASDSQIATDATPSAELIRARARISELTEENALLIGDVHNRDQSIAGLGRGLWHLRDNLDELLNEHGLLDGVPSMTAPAPIAAPVVEEASPAPAVPRKSQPTGGAPERTEGSGDREYRALGGLAAIAPAGLTEAAWAARTGYSRKGGAWIRRRKRYVDAGLLEQRDGRWFATAAGIEAAGGEIPDMPEPGPALVRWWCGRLSALAAKRALQLLGEVHPKALTRDAIAVELGMAPKGGAFVRAISELKASDLVVETKKRLSAAPELMGEG